MRFLKEGNVMAREAKDGIKQNFFLEKSLVEDLQDFCERTGRTKTKVVEIAIKEYLDKHKEDER